MAQNNEITRVPSNISINTPPGVEIIEHGRQIHMYRISDVELNEAYSPISSMNLGFFGITIGLIVPSGTILWTVTLDATQTAVFVAMLLCSIILSLYFGIQFGRDVQNAGQRKNNIRGRTEV